MHANLLKAHRAAGDFYATPPWATHALFDKIGPLEWVVWEPACGDGSMSRVIKERCPNVLVVSTDLHARGYGMSGIDFLKVGGSTSHVITNPPFSLAEPFVRHALKLASFSVHMLLKLNFLEGVARKKLFDEHPPAFVRVFSRRIKFALPGGRGGGVLAYAWFSWNIGQKTQPVIEWI